MLLANYKLRRSHGLKQLLNLQGENKIELINSILI